METVDSDAKKFLAKVIRTNAITFADDLTAQRWSSGYYVKTAIYQLGELTGTVIPYGGSPQSTVREAWNETFTLLKGVISGTVPGTAADGTPIRVPRRIP
jgi:hypothetical protein